MGTVEEYPLTTTRMIAWDSPSSWDVSSTSPQLSTSNICQPLTVNNLSTYVEAQSSTVMDSKSDIMTRYYSSMKSNHLDPPCLSPKSTNDHESSAEAVSKSTKNVAIDAYPLPFPYHNDCIFLPTVETGRTRFDSESTQSLYDNQPSSPTLSAFSSNKRPIYSATRGGGPSPSLSPSRHIPGYQRYRRASNTSHNSTVTTATGATIITHVSNTYCSSTTTQQRTRFRTTKNRLNTLITNKRYIPGGAQKRLSKLLTKEDKMTPFDQQSTISTSPKKVIYNQRGHISSPLLSTAALYEYYQASLIPSQQHRTVETPCYVDTRMDTLDSLPTIPSPVSPPESPATTYTYTTDSDMPTVISSSTIPREPSVCQNQLVYTASPSDQYHREHNKPIPSLSLSHRQHGFFARFARKFWPF